MCGEHAQVRPSEPDDLAWIKRVAGIIRKDPNRRTLACLFGVEAAFSSGFIEIRPHAQSVFETVDIDGSNRSFPNVWVEVTFRKDAQPLVATVYEAIGMPELDDERRLVSRLDLPSPPETTWRIDVSHSFEDSKRTRKVTISWEDQRGRTPDPWCIDHLSLTVGYPRELGRLAPGKYEVEARAGGVTWKSTCTVATSFLDPSECEPRVQEGLLVFVTDLSRQLSVRVFGRYAPVTLDVKKDGAPYASKTMSPTYPMVSTCNAAYDHLDP